jgi:gluconokinase
VDADGPETWAITVGTSAAVRTVLTQPPSELPAGLWRYRLDASRAVVGGALNNGGNIHAWLRRTLRLPPIAELERELLGRSWGAHGLTVDPSIFGERSPRWPLDATGSIDGINQRTTSVDIAQALLEAIAERISEIVRIMESAMGRPERMIATGGALVRSMAWKRMLECALDRSIERSPVRESSLRGAALLAIAAAETRTST